MTSTELISLIGIILGAAATVITGYFVLAKGRGDQAVALATLKAEEEKTRSEQEDRIAGRVSTELDRAHSRLDEQDGELTDMRQQLKDLRTSEEKTRRENSTIRDIVGQWFRDLLAWDRVGRRGAMPLPTREAMILLDLDPSQYRPVAPAPADATEPTL